MAFDWKNYVPSIGDERYKKSPFKPAIDFLRVLYYAHYSVDPSINYVDDNVVFYDPSLPIFGECYSVRGKFPFRIFFQSKYDGCLPDDTWTIAIKVDDKNLNDLWSNNQAISFCSSIVLTVWRRCTPICQ